MNCVNSNELLKFEYNDGGRSKYFKAKSVGDCVTRAIAIATGKDYLEVYKELGKRAGKSVRNGTPMSVTRKYLKELGYKWIGVNRSQGESMKMTITDVPKGLIIARLSKHLTVIKDGVIIDTYDPSRGGCRTIYGYWKIK